MTGQWTGFAHDQNSKYVHVLYILCCFQNANILNCSSIRDIHSLSSKMPNLNFDAFKIQYYRQSQIRITGGPSFLKSVSVNWKYFDIFNKKLICNPTFVVVVSYFCIWNYVLNSKYYLLLNSTPVKGSIQIYFYHNFLHKLACWLRYIRMHSLSFFL